MKFPLLSIVAACLALTVRPSASAQATITWGTPAPFSGPSVALTSGTFVAAASAYDSASTVNGITFASYLSSTLITYTGTHATYGPGVNSGDPAYNNILNIGFHSPDGGSATLTLSGLTAGQQYRVQVWTPAWNITWPTTLTSGNSVAMGNTATVPTYVTGTFTASGTSQTITYLGTNGSYGLMGAAALYAIPEPSTYALYLGTILLGLAVLRRRR